MTSFDEFMEIPPCASGSHSLEKPEEPVKPAVEAAPAASKDAEGREVYGAPAAAANAEPALPPLPAAPKIEIKDAAKPKSTAYVEEQDDPEVTVEKGARCKRKACGKDYDGGDRKDEECRYHAGVVRLFPFFPPSFDTANSLPPTAYFPCAPSLHYSLLPPGLLTRLSFLSSPRRRQQRLLVLQATMPRLR